MQNLKNFKPYTPSAALLKLYDDGSGEVPVFTISEDGHEWYESQKLFSDDTVKIKYNQSGVILGFVDKPVPARGNTYSVSMLFPEEGESIAEVAVEDFPPECSVDGTWKFDGEKVFQDTGVIDENALRFNSNKRNGLARRAAVGIATIKASAAVGNPRDGDSDNLLQLQLYLDALRDVDLNTPLWPSQPDFMN
ncbi:tail fiber assembly protein [Lelliottia wanjuensis]|uniref:tail fiber assembly protein n=1 Tax=Lelliottia wanjuensis TaxID=3050585 RepID=UPI00255116E4|nr:tail fiber assembly protein [Lelliottia sp. V104_15]MDK9607123.1 tail fiber assembly protein [Lelliottia sp. V104_15]